MRNKGEWTDERFAAELEGLKVSRKEESRTDKRRRKHGGDSLGRTRLGFLFAEARDRVEGALFPVAALSLQIPDVQLISKSLHDLFREQVIDQSGLDAAVVVHQLKQTISTTVSVKQIVRSKHTVLNYQVLH